MIIIIQSEMKEGIILKVEGLNKYFNYGKSNEFWALKDVSFSIDKGEFISIMGPSGSGKSTLLYAISGMDHFNDGSVKLFNTEIHDLPETRLAELRLNQMGFIFQDSHLLKHLNIVDNILYTGYVSKKHTKQQVDKKAKELMKQMGIAQLANNAITEASGGQLQKVGICRALINEPDILFADEPTGALNSSSTADILEILLKLNEKGITIIMVTHDINVASHGEKVLFLNDGKLITQKDMGKFNSGLSDSDTRERELSNWLVKQGF